MNVTTKNRNTAHKARLAMNLHMMAYLFTFARRKPLRIQRRGAGEPTPRTVDVLLLLLSVHLCYLITSAFRATFVFAWLYVKFEIREEIR
jgi:hypothetical protein